MTYSKSSSTKSAGREGRGKAGPRDKRRGEEASTHTQRQTDRQTDREGERERVSEGE